MPKQIFEVALPLPEHARGDDAYLCEVVRRALLLLRDAVASWAETRPYVLQDMHIRTIQPQPVPFMGEEDQPQRIVIMTLRAAVSIDDEP